MAGELWQFHQTNHTAPEDMVLRTKQLLGLPATNSGNVIAEFWVSPSSLFRPAVDESLTNPVTDIDESKADAWYNNRKATIYQDSQNPPFPWTRAGYTYDWGTGTSDHVGLSEFVARSLSEPGASAITVRSVFSAVSYLYYVRATDSFNVTDWCDTIWAGTKYLPATVGGNQLDIAATAIICHDNLGQGEGILVSDLAGQNSNWVINNHGTILGPGSATRHSSVSFVNAGGVLNNFGLITGDVYGVLGDDACSRPIVVNNCGTITGTADAIRTGGGDDIMNVTGGVIVGTIDGGAGHNVLNFNLPGDVTFVFNNNILNVPVVNVNSGTLRFNGSAASDFNIGTEGTLSGNCSLTGVVLNRGTISPGNSVGTIRVTGDYNQMAGGRYLAEISRTAGGATRSDQLLVSGTAYLAGDSRIDVRYDNHGGSVFQSGDLFPIIKAGTLNDNGAAIAYDSAFLRFSAVRSGGDYDLLLTRSASFRSAATSANNAAIAGALDGDGAAASGGYADLINRLLFSNDAAGFNGALQQFSPAPYLAAYAATDRTTQYLAESTSDYLRKRRAGQINPCLGQALRCDDSWSGAGGGPSETAGMIHYCAGGDRSLDCEMPEMDRTRSVWVDPFGLFFGERTCGDHLGFQSNVAGVQFGIDKQFSEQWIIGFGGGYCQTHLDTSSQPSAGQISTFRVGPYASWFDGDWYLDTSLTGGFHDNNLGRSVNVEDAVGSVEGQYHANDLSFYSALGRDYRMGPYVFSPQVSLQYIYYRQYGFSETGVDLADLLVDPRDANSLRSRVGGQLSSAVVWGNVKVLREVFAGWAHEYLGNDPLVARFVGGVTPFSIDDGGLFRDAGYFGASLSAIPNPRTLVFARYNGEYSSGSHVAAVDLGLTISF